MKDRVLYSETISSRWTEGLFLLLMMIFLLLSTWRLSTAGLDGWAIVLLCLGGLFFLYSINYRNLHIHLTEEQLTLKFGIFRWRVALKNIDTCQPDEGLPRLVRYGGAGIHFMLHRDRYRVSFNFLEYPRLVIGLKHKAGLVRDVSFTTRQPLELLQAIEKARGRECLDEKSKDIS